MLETAVEQLTPAIDSAIAKASGPVWLEALPARVYHTPQYGEVPVTLEKLQRMVRNFKEGVRGQEIAVDYDHGMDRSKGNKAAGWYRDFAIRPSSDDPSQMSLWAAVEFTEEARHEIKDGQWKYFSLEWDDAHLSSTDGSVHSDVIVGGGITNRPVAKKTATLPVNFSESLWDELTEDERKMFSVWSTAQVNDLPDSAFLYIQSGGTKDSEGKTTPRNLRHFPYKDASGKVDLPHLRNAIARIPQSGSWLSDALKTTLQAKSRALLAASSKMAESAIIKTPPASPGDNELGITDAVAAVRKALDKADDPEDKVGLQKALDHLNSVAGLEKKELSEVLSAITYAFDEVAEWEHSEPGTGPSPQIGSPEQPDPGTGQPVPRVQGDPAAEDPAIGGAWRRSPLPLDPNDPGAPHAPGRTFAERNTMTPEQVAELKKLYGLDPESDDEATNAKLVESVKKSFSETTALREAVGAVDEEKRFSEQFPAMYAQQQALLAESRESKARMFSEAVSTITKPEGDKFVPSGHGLSALATEKVAEVHKKFSEGTATTADFEEAIKTITNGGVVQFGEVGSGVAPEQLELDTNSLQGLNSAKKLFAEKVAEVQREAEFSDYATAIREAGRRFPDLAEAYSRTPVVA